MNMITPIAEIVEDCTGSCRIECYSTTPVKSGDTLYHEDDINLICHYLLASLVMLEGKTRNIVSNQECEDFIDEVLQKIQL